MDEIVARIDASPPLHAAIHDAGLTAREYLLFSATFQQAMRGYSLRRAGQLPADVPPSVRANIDFVDRNLPAIRQLVRAQVAGTPDSSTR